MICTIEKTTITIDTDVKLNDDIYTFEKTSLVKISDNKVFIAHNLENDSNLYGTVCTIEGATITARKSTKIGSYAGSGNSNSVVHLVDNKIFIIQQGVDRSDFLYGIINFVEVVDKLDNSTQDNIFGVSKTKGTFGQTVKVIVPN